MNALERQTLWEQLRAAGCAQGEMPPLSCQEPAAPWYLRVLLGIAAWIASLFLFAFIGTLFSDPWRDKLGQGTVGVVCYGATYVLFRRGRAGDFAGQFALALSFAGQGFLLMALLDWLEPWRGGGRGWYAVFALEAILAAFWRNEFHRLYTTWAAFTALSYALLRDGWSDLAPATAAAGFAWIHLNQARWGKRADLWRPVGYGLALSMIQIEAVLLWGGELPRVVLEEFGWLSGASWLGRLLPGLVFLGMVLELLRRESVSPRAGPVLLGLCGLLALAGLWMPGLASALLILVLGFACSNRILLGLGLAALALFLSHYYYQLQTTLLMKSALLAVSGTLLLGGRRLGRRWLQAGEERNHA